MAGVALPLSVGSKRGKIRKKRAPKGASVGGKKTKSINWSDSLPDDPFSLLSNSNEGGFLSLEEIDDVDFGLIGEPTAVVEEDKGKKKKTKKKNNKESSLPDSKKRKRDENAVSINGDEPKKEEGEKETNRQNEKTNDKKLKKNNNNKKKENKNQPNDRKNNNNKKENKNQPNEKKQDKKQVPKAKKLKRDTQDEEDYLILREDEIYAWKELRLHPLLMQSIQRLGFREPTPIQKACIPAAAHQGKDVIGAAETGSGKTLAFGLPILQRLLEEREKASRFVEESEKLSNKLSETKKKDNTESPLRALIITPTRELALQVCDHLKKAAKGLDIFVVPIVGGISSEKQDRLLKMRPHIVVATPGRLWELMSAGHQHLVELHSLSFFILDEADRMIEAGHFQELQSIIDLITSDSDSNLPRKKRQTLVFSATISLSENFRKKLKKGGGNSASKSAQGMSSIESLSERAGVRPDAAVVDLTSEAIMAAKLEESFIECGEEDKDAYLYYILSVHGQGRAIVFCTSIAALRHLAAILRLLKVNAWSLHAQMQQRARLKAMDRFRASESGVLIATDVAARGLDIPRVRTVVHYQLPHSAEVYIHRSGRTARADTDGCSIALIGPNDKAKFYSLCRSLSKESLKQFPVDSSYMSEIMKRLSLARQVDNIMRKNSQEKAKKSWVEKNAEALGVEIESIDREEEREMVETRDKQRISSQLEKAQQELNELLERPLQPRTLSHRYLAGAGVTLEVQKQLEELSKKKVTAGETGNNKKSRFVVIGQNTVEPLDALRSAGQEVCVNLDKKKEMHKKAEVWKKKKREEKKKDREQKRKARKKAKERM
ncbi:hypothetical protein LUZ60_016281 [Juncus effusus]|nr:hypothetical protein LUZ60_016281 [Juncus effusus]